MIPVPCFIEIEKLSTAAITEIAISPLVRPAMGTGDKFLPSGRYRNIFIVCCHLIISWFHGLCSVHILTPF